MLASWFVVLGGVGVAAARYGLVGSGSVRSASQLVQSAATPIAVASGADVAVSWTAVVLSSGTPAGGYVVRRYNGSNVAQAVGSACTSASTGAGTTSCVEHQVPDGAWWYSVQATKGSWSGAESGKVAVSVAVPPRLVSLVGNDTNGNGKVDQVVATFDDTLATPYSSGTTGWTLANVPSGGTLAAVSTSGTTATLSLTEGAGAVSTATTGFTVALAATANGVRDTNGNLSSFAATAVTDHASPLATAIADSNGTTDGKLQLGDTVTFTFSEPILASSVPTSVSVVIASAGGSANNTMSISGVTAGAISLGGNKYLSGTNTSATFAATAAVSGAAITVTLGACSGSCASLGTQTPAANVVYLPAATISDATGNAAAQVSKTVSLKLF